MGRKPVFVGRWRGHDLIRSANYAHIRMPSSPLANARGLVLVHRLIACELLGRQVTRSDAVRFRDGNRWNLDPTNLVVVSQAEWLWV